MRLWRLLFRLPASAPTEETTGATLHRLRWMRWWVPLILMALVVAYEFGISRLIHEVWGSWAHYVVDALVYGTVGPLLAFGSFSFLIRWLEERQTSELQAKILKQAREYARHHHEFTDSTLQSLFATSLFLQAVTANRHHLPPTVASQLQTIHQSLDATIRGLREHLLRQDPQKSADQS